MQALAIIPDLNKVKYYPSKIVIIIVLRFYGEFCFKGFKETLGRSIIPAIAFAASCFGGPAVGLLATS